MSISRFHIEAEPKTTNVEAGELTFNIWRGGFYTAATVMYIVRPGTAEQGTDYDDSLDAYSGYLSFDKFYAFDTVRLAVLGAGTGTVTCELRNPSDGQIIAKHAIGYINAAGSVRYYAATGTGTGDGSSPANAKTFSSSDFDTFISTKDAGRTVLFKRGDTFNLTNRVAVTRGQGGTIANPMIIGAYGTGEKPVFTSSNYATNYIGVAAATSADEDHSIVLRDMEFQPLSNSGNTCGPIVRSIDNPSPLETDGPYLNWWIERCDWTNPNNYAGFTYGIQVDDDTSNDMVLIGATMSDMTDRFINYDGGSGGVFTVGNTITGGTSGATAVIVEVIGDAFSGKLRVEVDTVTGTWQDNEAVSDTGDGGSGVAVVNIPTPSENDPNGILGLGGTGIIYQAGRGLRTIANRYVNIGRYGTDAQWCQYLEADDLYVSAIICFARQGMKIRGSNGFIIEDCLSEPNNGAQNFNFNYYPEFSNLENGALRRLVAIGPCGFRFSMSDNSDHPDNTWGIKNVEMDNCVAIINEPHLYSLTLSYALQFGTFNVTNVVLKNLTLIYSADYDGIPIQFRAGTVKDDKFILRNTLVKVPTSSISTYAIIRSYSSGTPNFEGDGNLFDYASGDLFKDTSNTYADLAAWQAAESTELNSIEASVTLSNPSGITGLEIVPDAGGNADGAGLTGLVAYDFRNRLRPSAPTIGAWELNDAAIRGTFGGFF